MRAAGLLFLACAAFAGGDLVKVYAEVRNELSVPRNVIIVRTF